MAATSTVNVAAERVGIIGAGSMGGAIARGLITSELLDPSAVFVADPDSARQDEFATLGVTTFSEATDLLAAKPTCLILAVKPQILPSVLSEIADEVSGLLVISIAAGVTTKTVADALVDARIVRVMPNLPVQVRSGASAICAGPKATDADLKLTSTLFSALGSVGIMREDQLEVAGAVSGTAPAFFALFVDTLTRAGVKAGLPSQTCREMLLATMAGCAEQLKQEDVHPRSYLERVTSPGGTTAAALEVLEPALFEGSFAAVDAALARSRELAGA